ncbi:transglutaminase family protein [Solicola gregarius]|uniref:DUF3488 and transglutaminase-like domain-containing protein n=1 Tax=Solicola gregarius TaxID=2908642 RepID=A0AA46THC1_9ACTN|nr:DUF3488 and transglutaminase-like domain-containing protein [Solicola gregarius]UYM05364.1 DUF3488 and transglutaminase-like domain-containing protein [Solicola gregarius]
MKVHRDARDQARMALWIWLAALGGSFALAPLTESRAYVIVGFVSAGLVVLVGLGLRTVRTPWPLILLAELVALFWWAMLTYASDTTAFGLVPTGDTFREFDAILTDALDHAQQYAAPVPQDASLHALLAITVGLIAIAIDLLAGSLQHSPAVGLVFLAVYMAPVALLSGHVSLWFFVPGALAYVFLIAAEERSTITRWGRNISYADSTALAQSGGIYSSGLASAGRRVGFGAVALAVVVPLVVPTFSTNFFGSGGIDGGGQGPGGNGDVQLGDPMADMRRNLTGQSPRELVRMTGISEPSYVRLAALDSLSDAGWEPSQRGPKTQNATSGTPPFDPGRDPEVTTSTAAFDVKVSDDFDTTWLPTIYSPASFSDMDDDGSWLIDGVNLDVVAGDEDTSAAGIEYRLGVRYTHPTQAQLEAAGDTRDSQSFRPMLELPESTPAIVGQRADEVTEGEESDFDKAVAIQDWFRSTGGFTYSTAQASGSGMETIESFLKDDRVGYCEQFASAMAMMARSLGIPARVAVGFLDGEQNGDTYVFRGTDMHAWPELYLEGVGWTRFEPTPGQRTGAPPAFFEGSSDNANTDQTLGQSGNAKTPTDDSSPSANLDKVDATGGGGGNDDGGFPWMPVAVGALILALLVLLGFVPRTLRSIVRRRRWEAVSDPTRAAEAAWDELRDTVRDLRLPWPEGATPRATGRRLRPMIESRQHAVDGLNHLVLAVERARYAPSAEPTDLRDDVTAIGDALASRVSRRTRRKALWLPASLLGGVRLPWRTTGAGRGRGGQTELLALEE